MHKTKRVLLLAGGLLASQASAQPPYLVPAMKYGARDCGFCHQTPEGGGHNQRGAWLLAEMERRRATTVDVDWLSERDPIVPNRVTRNPEGVAPGLPPLDRDPGDADRPFDYSTRHGDWPAYSGDLLATKYSPLDQLNPGSVTGLARAWTWAAQDNARFAGESDRSKTPDPFKATPLMAGGRLYVRTSYSAVEALDPLTGVSLWTFDPGTGDGPRPAMFGFSSRGLAWYRGKSADRLILLTSDGYLVALDPGTGIPVESFGARGRVDLTVGLRRPLERRRNSWNYPPAICGDVIVVGNQTSDGSHYNRGSTRPWNENLPLGDVRGFDAETGRQLWVFRTVPQEGEFGNDTWGGDSWRWMGNTNVWSMMSCDPALGHVYLPVTAPTHHFYGGFRHGDNLFATSVVALDAATGERQWHFQAVHHDIWDYDLPAAPVVTDIVVAGKPVEAVTQVGKTGFVYVLDRKTGKPVWPIEERPVPPSRLEGERASPTQPHPTWPPPFESQGISAADLVDFTPEIRRRALALAGDHIGPLFTPPSEQGTLMNPGFGGGANWGGAAFDPDTRTLYVPSRRMPTLVTARRVDEARFGWRWAVRTSRLDIDGIPVVKPPWGSITAYDLDTGNILWQVANGAGMKDHPLLRGLDLPDLGEVQAPGLLVTKSLIFHGHRGRGGSTSALVARRKDTGEVVFRHDLPGSHAQAPPMTYLAGGRQFVVIATGASTEPQRLTAFRLP